MYWVQALPQLVNLKAGRQACVDEALLPSNWAPNGSLWSPLETGQVVCALSQLPKGGRVFNRRCRPVGRKVPMDTSHMLPCESRRQRLLRVAAVLLKRLARGLGHSSVQGRLAGRS